MSVNPDEVVAMGAAVQGGVLAGDVEGILLLDVTPLSPGRRDHGRRHDQDDRPQHHHPHPQDRDLLHRGRQPDLRRGARAAGRAPDGRRQQDARHASSSPAFRPRRRGVPQIEVTFDIDANGIVNVSAKDLGTGKQQQITISGSTALSDDEVDRMVKDAEAACRRGRAAARKRSRFATTPTLW